MDTPQEQPFVQRRVRKEPFGRPRELTYEVIEKAKTLLSSGIYLETLYASIGVSAVAFRKWMKRGKYWLKRYDKHAEEIPENEQIFVDLVITVEKALADCEMGLVVGINVAGEKNWTAYAWMLERRWAQRWSKPNPDAVNPTTQAQTQAAPPVFNVIVTQDPMNHGDKDDDGDDDGLITITSPNEPAE